MPEGYGKIAFAASVISYFSIFAQLGIPTYGVRVCAKARDNKEKLSKIVQELFIINSIITVLVYLVLIVLIQIIPKFEQYKALLLINSLVLMLNLFGMEFLYRAVEQYSYITIRSLVFKIIALILTFSFIHQSSDYIIYAIITVFAIAGSNLVNLFNARKFINMKPLGEYNLKQHIKPLFTFFALTAVVSIYTNLDIVMLGFMKGDTEVGFYSAAVKIKYLLATLVSSLGIVLLPRMSYYVEKNMKNEFQSMVLSGINFVLLSSIPLAIYFLIYSEQCIQLLAGSSYLDAVPAMMVIIPSIVFIGLSNILGMQVLVPTNREKITLISVIIGAIVNVALNIIFIPKMGATGAAVGTLVAEISVLVVQAYYLRGFLLEVTGKINLRYIIVAIIVATSLVIMLKMVIIHSLVVSLIISSIVFFGSYLMILFIQKEPLISRTVSQFLKCIFRV